MFLSVVSQFYSFAWIALDNQSKAIEGWDAFLADCTCGQLVQVRSERRRGFIKTPVIPYLETMITGGFQLPRRP